MTKAQIKTIDIQMMMMMMRMMMMIIIIMIPDEKHSNKQNV